MDLRALLADILVVFTLQMLSCRATQTLKEVIAELISTKLRAVQSVGLSDSSYSEIDRLTLNQLVPGSNPGAGILLLLRSRFDSLSVPLRLMLSAGAEP